MNEAFKRWWEEYTDDACSYMDYKRSFEAGWKECVLYWDIDTSYDEDEGPEINDDFPLYLEYHNEDDSMYLNDRLYGDGGE